MLNNNPILVANQDWCALATSYEIDLKQMT